MKLRTVAALTLLSAVRLVGPLPAGALELPFTEDFDADVANWVNFNSSALLDFNASGGPDGSSYASGGINFVNLEEGDDPVVLRCKSRSRLNANRLANKYVSLPQRLRTGM